MNSRIELEPEVIAELEKGKKVSAIKVLRELRGIGLKESKEMIDEYSKHSKNGNNARDTNPGSKSKLGLMLVLAGIAYLVYSFIS